MASSLLCLEDGLLFAFAVNLLGNGPKHPGASPRYGIGQGHAIVTPSTRYLQSGLMQASRFPCRFCPPWRELWAPALHSTALHINYTHDDTHTTLSAGQRETNH